MHDDEHHLVVSPRPGTLQRQQSIEAQVSTVGQVGVPMDRLVRKIDRRGGPRFVDGHDSPPCRLCSVETTRAHGIINLIIYNHRLNSIQHATP